jgi:hypothetical protein
MKGWSCEQASPAPSPPQAGRGSRGAGHMR